MSEDTPSLDDLLLGYLESGSVDDASLAALDPEDRARFGDAVADLDALRAELREPATWEQPSPDLEDAIVAALLAEPAAQAPTHDAPSVGAAGPGGRTATPGRPAPDETLVSLADARARRSRTIAVVASIVAAAAVVLAVVGFVTRPTGGGSESAGPPTTAAPRGPVTIGPGVVAALEPTELLPGASGRVRLDETASGVWIRMDATGLPRRDDGEFYEAWVRTPQGMVPIGTFHTGDDVVLWSGVSIDDTDAVTVTLEKNDGNQESSGQRVLLATIPHPGNATPSRPGATTPAGTSAPSR